jgi:Flp pilus assembly protein TadG
MLAMRMKWTLTLKGKSDEKGQAVVELAMVLPLLLLLLFGVFDFSRAIHATSIITQMSREAANLVARPNTSLTGDDVTDFQNAMYFIAMDAGQLNMKNQGMMYITKVQYVGSSNTITVNVQVPWNQENPANSSLFASKLPNVGTVVQPSQLGNITLTPANSVAYVVEVFYQYKSIFLLGNVPFLSTPVFKPTLYSVSIF